MTQSGKMCVAEPDQAASCGGPTAKPRPTLSIRGGGKPQPVDFAPRADAARRGRPTCRSPTAANIRSNGPEAATSSKLNFVTVNAPPTDLVGAAQVLIDKGCQNQLDLLVESAGKAK